MPGRSVYYIIFAVVVACWSCRGKAVSTVDVTQILYDNEDQLTRLMIHDVFTPPVASRIYAYTSLALYEAIRFRDPSKFPSLLSCLKGFENDITPDRGKKYDFDLAGNCAFFAVARKMIFSTDSLAVYENRVYERFRPNLDPGVFERSLNFGRTIGALILRRAATDNYIPSRGKPRFSGSNAPGKWRPTPPDYLDGVEYCWGTMKTFVLDSSSQFAPVAPPAYSADTASDFYHQNLAVYRAGQQLTAQQKEIARYWDDNPFVLEHSGHMMFANKKITPGGHWMGITQIACKATGAGAVKTAQAYCLVSLAMFDAFICCWEEKYRSSVIRPVSFINDQIDPKWSPYLQTPPFPEYPSGHSTITRAAATVLTRLFGGNFKFLDSSDFEYIGMKRHFSSFLSAANEASVSRFYGGIHYLSSIEAGAGQGEKVAEFIIGKLPI